MNIAGQIKLRRSVFSKYIEESKNFSLAFKDSMKSRIKEFPAENTLWSYVSQITEEAHNYREYERMEIEKQAGIYLDEIVRKEVKRGKYSLAVV